MKVFPVTSPNITKEDFDYIKGICDVVGDARDSEIILALGGDNAMLGAIHMHQNLGKPFLGLNYGHVGFLLNDARPSTPLYFEQFVQSAEMIDLWLIGAVIEYTDGTTRDVYGFNDVYMSPIDGQILKMRLSVNGTEIPDQIIGDGFIVSTPQGSTGYNRAARGKIIKPGSPILQLTPKFCTIGSRRSIMDSFIEPDDTMFKVEFIDGQWRKCNVFYDGLMVPRSEANIKSITFSKSSKTASLLFGKDFNFYEKVYRLKYHQEI